MKSRWQDDAARSMVAHYARAGVSPGAGPGVGPGVGKDVALCVYASRLFGRDPNLVLHGGGNSSVKTGAVDLLGQQVEVLHVKGSGWDMGAIEPPGLPALRLAPLRALRNLKALTDEDMVSFQRSQLLDGAAPNPSVETLLHAFLPHKFVLHCHSTAVLSLSDQPDGQEICRRVFGDKVAMVPYIMPGFKLAKRVAAIFEADPTVEAMVLHKHGLVSFGETAESAYRRTVAVVNRAEKHIARTRRPVFAKAKLPAKLMPAADVAPILRGACALPGDDETAPCRHMVAVFRTDRTIRGFVDGAALDRYAGRGVVTPDHIIRTKNTPLIVPPPGGADAFAAAVHRAVTAYASRYRRNFARFNGKRGAPKVELDPMPRVVLVPGLGLFALGRSAKDAGVVADLACNTVRVITDAEAIGSYRTLSAAHLFDMEYWSLEQVKLGKGEPKALAGQVALVTGGGGTIGAATARAFAAAGAAVAVLDLDRPAAERVAAEIGGAAVGIACDVTDRQAVRRAFDRVCTEFGGVDIVVSNAGVAITGRIGELADEVLRRSFEINFFAHQTVAQNAVRVMRLQGMGGVLLFNASKQAVNPGKDFGAYGLPKAATLFLSRQYALDHGAEGIRANAVNADRIRGGMLTDAMVRRRAAARGLSARDYLAGNLLGEEVTAEDVAQAFVHQALARRTTADVTTVDGGNIAAALR